MKAVAGERGPLLFRPQMHARRMNASARRLCMPEVPEELFLGALRALVHEDASWVPTEPGASLYLRPTMIATEAYLGVRPSKKYLFFVLASPVGNYFGPRPDAAPALGGDRARARCPGRHRRGQGRGQLRRRHGSRRAGRRRRASTRSSGSTRRHRDVEEAGTMNVFFRIDDTVVTPPLEDSLLAGRDPRLGADPAPRVEGEGGGAPGEHRRARRALDARAAQGGLRHRHRGHRLGHRRAAVGHSGASGSETRAARSPSGSTAR